MTDDPSLAYTPSRYYSSSNRNCPPVSCSIYIYILCVSLFRSLGIDRVWRTFDEWNERSWSNYETCFVYNRLSNRKTIRGKEDSFLLQFSITRYISYLMFRRCVHIGLCKMFVQLYFLFFIITLLPDVPPEFSLMQTKIQHVCLSNVYLNGVERGVIFPNVKKQQSLETLLFSKLLFPRFPNTCRIVNYRKQRRNTPFYQTFISSPLLETRRIFTFVWTKKLKLSQFNHKFLNFHILFTDPTILSETIVE